MCMTGTYNCIVTTASQVALEQEAEIEVELGSNPSTLAWDTGGPSGASSGASSTEPNT